MSNKWMVSVGLAAVLALALGTTEALAQGKSATSPAQSPAIGTLTVEGIADTPTSIYGFGVEMSQSTSFGGGGGGAGKADVSDVTMTRRPDTASPLLFRAGVIGQHLPSARVDVFAPGTTNVQATYRLTEVLIAGMSTIDSTEVVTLRFARIEITVGGTTTCWDIAQNVTC
jgi:type VI protein secretion system component Hcp